MRDYIKPVNYKEMFKNTLYLKWVEWEMLQSWNKPLTAPNFTWTGSIKYKPNPFDVYEQAKGMETVRVPEFKPERINFMEIPKSTMFMWSTPSKPKMVHWAEIAEYNKQQWIMKQNFEA